MTAALLVSVKGGEGKGVGVLVLLKLLLVMANENNSYMKERLYEGWRAGRKKPQKKTSVKGRKKRGKIDKNNERLLVDQDCPVSFVKRKTKHMKTRKCRKGEKEIAENWQRGETKYDLRYLNGKNMEAENSRGRRRRRRRNRVRRSQEETKGEQNRGMERNKRREREMIKDSE